MSRAFRRARAAGRLGFARLRMRPWNALLVGTGVAAATALLVGVLGGSMLTRDRALRDAVASLPAQDRGFRVDLFGLPVQQPFDGEDRAARRALASLVPGEPVRVSFFHDALVDGTLVRLVAIDGLSRFVRLERGRLPRTCVAAACEVLQVGSGGRPDLREGGIHLVRTGAGRILDPSALGPAFQGLHTYGTQEGVRAPLLLITPSTRAVERIPDLSLLFRVRSWMAPVPALRAWKIDGLLARETRAQNSLHEADGAFRLAGPDDALLAARDRGAVSAKRMTLLGAGSSVLLLGFVLVAAMGLRSGIAAGRRRMLQHGATRWQVLLAVLVEVGAMTLVASLAGICLGVLAVALLSASLGVPAGPVIRHGLLGTGPLLALLAIWLAAAGVALAPSVGPREGAPRRRVRLLDVAAVGAALAVLVGVRHESLDSARLASGRSPTILLLLPLLVCFVAAVAAARLLGPLMGVAERLSRRGTLALGLALLGLARAPSRTAAAGSFLVVAVGLSLFAATYRATLDRSARDQAGFESPLGVRIVQGRRPLLTFGAAAGGTQGAQPVVRRAADVAGTGTSAQGVTVLGVPPDALREMYWRGDFSSTSRARLAARVRADEPVSLHGMSLPAGATSATADVRVRGAPLHLGLALADAQGVVRTLSLGRAGRGRSKLTARLPRADSPLRVTGLELSLTQNGTSWFFHLDQEGRLVRPPDGALTVQSLSVARANGPPVPVATRNWIVRVPGGTVASRSPLVVAYTFDEGQTIVVRPRQQTDRRALRVVASRTVAAAAGPGGTVALDFGTVELAARVVGVARRFPTVGVDEPFAVADAATLRTALDADAPGAATPDELWASRPPLRGDRSATVVVRDALAARAERDPLARAIGYTLGVSAILALALAAAGLWVALLGGLADEQRDLVDLEAQGAPPAVLRNQLRLRSLALLAFGVLAGLVLGVVLTRLVVSLVQVSAETTVPDPPLALQLDWSRLVLVLAAFCLVALAALELTLRAAFRSPTPARNLWSIE